MTDPIQPWDLPLQPDEVRKRLAINLPRLLPPLADAGSPGPMSEKVTPKPALADTPTTTPLAVQPQKPKPLAEQYGDIQGQIKAASQPVTEPHLNVGRRILGTLLSLSSNPQMAEVGRDWTHPAAAAQRTKLAALTEQAKGLGTESEIANRESEIRTREIPKPDTQEEWNVVPNVFGPNREPVQQEKRSGQVRVVTTPGVQVKDTDKPDTQTERKQKIDEVTAKLDKAGLPTDPKSLPNSLNIGLKRKIINSDEHAAVNSYFTTDAAPSTTVQVQTTAAQTKQQIKDDESYWRWRTPDGKIVTGKGREAPQGVTKEPIGDDKAYKDHLHGAKTSNIIQQTFNRLSQDIDKNPEIFDNPAARAILATTLEQMDRASAGLLVAGTGGHVPLPSGIGSIINTALQNKALDEKTARALKDYISDYKSAKDMAVVLQMEMQGGKIGRGFANVFNAIVDQMPNGKTPDSVEARRQMSNLQQKQTTLASDYADDGKEKPYQMKADGQQLEPGLKAIVDKMTPAQKDAYNKNRQQRGLPPL